MQLIRAAAALLLLLPAAAGAAVLADDRADLMYHYYDGGGVTIDGPSLLVRKKFAEKYAVNASYYVDMVSSASIDVVTTASPYKEERTQYGVGFEYLRGKVTYAANFSDSSENDYEAKTASLAIGQDMFGDLTTVSLFFTRGWDDVSERGNATFADTVDRRIYGVDVSQIATKSLILGLAYETITEEGFLNNPYRQVRFLDPDAALGYSYEKERYPRTRTGNALGLRARWYLPYRAALEGNYRFYTDTWEIRGHTAEVSYTHPLDDDWTFDVHYRFYTQNAAEFYSDLFPREDFQNFLARDKELASMTSHTLGFGVAWAFKPARVEFLSKASVNLRYDHMLFDYDDFRDLRVTGVAPGTEPLYSFGADVIRLYFSGWF
ncbi:MAG TPA: DUF3570 domain-containing protein [Steroidobacteraceae bacterium]|nr:DUF3570 domain-containing protein [Steroidobacteraceae bacterium]